MAALPVYTHTIFAVISAEQVKLPAGGAET